MRRIAPTIAPVSVQKMLIAIFLFLTVTAFGQVTITGGGGGSAMCADDEYVTLSPIVISETAVGNFNIRTFVVDTLNLGLSNPAFKFEPNSGSVSFTGTGAETVIATINVTETKVAVRIVEGNDANAGGLNAITISGLKVKASSPVSPAYIRRFASGQEFGISGLGVGTNLATLASFSPPTVSAGSDEVLCSPGVLNFSSKVVPASVSPGANVLWTHNGSGTSFTNAWTLTPSYTTGPSEVGTVLFTLTATNSNGSCSSVSDVMELEIAKAPVITGQPASQSVCEGGTINLSVTAQGTDLTYEWFRGATSLGAASAAANTLTITNANASHAGDYTVVVRGACDDGMGVTSSIATVVVDEAPEVIAHPAHQTVCEDGSTTFTVNAGATSSPQYQWQVNRNDGAGYVDLVNDSEHTNVTTATLTVQNTPLAANGYLYRARITSSATCSATAFSNAAVLTVQEKPVIDVQPVSQTLCEGSTISLSVTAHGTGLTYQWFRDGASLGAASATATTLMITNANASHAGDYTVVVRGTCDATGVASSVAAITIEEAPEVTTHPVSQTICEDGTTTFAVNAGDTESPVYQWQVNRNDGSGYVDLVNNSGHTNVTTATLTVQNTPLAANGYLYRARITSSATCTATAFSNAAVLTVQEKPVIDVQPVAQTLCEGSTISLSVTAHGTGLTYQWFRDGASLGAASATATTLMITNANASHAGDYTVVVRGTCDATGVTSSVAAITIEEAPEVIAHPANQTICEDGSTTFSVDAGITASPQYQWQVNRNDGAGYVDLVNDSEHTNVTTATLTVQNTPLAANGYLYRARITSSATCSATAFSNAAVLTVQEKPVIDVQPVSQTLCEGSTISLSVTAHGTGLTYQWYRDGAYLGAASATATTLTITNANASHAGDYTVVVRGTCDATGVTSSVAAITIEEAPEVIAHPANQTICEDGSTTFSVDAGITASPQYQWQVNRNDGAGYVDLVSDAEHANVTTATLTVQSTPYAFSGYLYRAKISSSGTCTATALSNAAILTVHEKPVIDVQPVGATLCRGESVTFNVEAHGTGLIYQWQKDGVNIGAASANTSLTLIGVTVADAGSYTVVVSGSCTPAVTSAPAVLSVQELPVVTNSHDQLNIQICSGEALTFVPQFSIPGTTFTWQSEYTAEITAGVTATGSDFSTQVPINNTSSSGTITYRITPHINGCDGVPFNFVVTVKPLPSVSAADKTICSGEETNITLLPSPKNVPGTTFSWAATSTNVTGAASGNGTSINHVLTTDENGGTVLYVVTPSANGCVGPEHTITVTVNPIPVADAGADFSVCEPTSFTLTGTIGGSATSATWTVGVGAAGTLSSSSISGNVVTATYTVVAADLNKTFSFYLTTNDPDAAGPCSAAMDEVRVTVHQLPEVALSELKPQYAENDAVQLLSGFPTKDGVGVFTGPGIVAGTNQFNPANANIGFNTITYTFTSSITGCVNSDSKTTLVNALTDIDFDIGENPRRAVNGDLLICENLDRQPINGYPHPSEGRVPTSFISEDGKLSFIVEGGEWFIQTNGLGGSGAYEEYMITYEFTNQDNATQRKTKKLIVYRAPVASINMQPGCASDSITFIENSFRPDGVTSFTYLWNFGENNNVSYVTEPIGPDEVYPPKYKYVTSGTKNISFTITSNTGCTDTDQHTLLVGKPPELDFSYTKICSEIQATEFRSLIPESPLYTVSHFEWDFADVHGVVDGAAGSSVPAGTHGGATSGVIDNPVHRYDASGEYVVRLSVSTAEGCVASVVKNIYILEYSTPQATLAYFDDFESGTNWRAPQFGTTSWVFGLPEGDVINSAASGSNAWWTGKNTNLLDDNSFYYRNENSEVLGPCLDLTQVKRPMISMKYWSDTPLGYDGAVLQYSTDGGQNWTTIGDAEGAGINWYNTRNMAANPGGQDNHAWSDTTMGWRTARYSLDGIPQAERNLVVFRIAFSSTEKGRGDTRPMEGFAFDDVYIGEKTRNVLVEHFTNAEDAASAPARQWFNSIESGQLLRRDSADFIVLQYHMANPVFDQLNADNPVDPYARAQWYGVANPPVAIMDGIQGNYFANTFNGSYQQIDEIELDRRSLEEPLFHIGVSLNDSDVTRLTGTVNLTYTGEEDFATTIMLHAALVENGLGATNRNVLRALIWGPQGKLLNGPFASGQTINDIAINFDMNTVVSDPDNLSLIVFVQDKNTKKILQSTVIKAPSRQSVIVGVPEDPGAGILKHLQVYPNPASQQINFAMDRKLDRDYEWRIVDQRGVTVLYGGLNRDLSDPQTVDISRLANGIYFLAIRTGDRAVYYRKIAVMNR